MRSGEAWQDQQQQKKYQQCDEEQQNKGFKVKITSMNNAAGNGMNGISGDNNTKDALTMMVREMKRLLPWLSKRETLLAPYAWLARDIHSELQLLEVQQRNLSTLQPKIGHLLRTVTLPDAEDELLDGLDRYIHELPTHPI